MDIKSGQTKFNIGDIYYSCYNDYNNSGETLEIKVKVNNTSYIVRKILYKYSINNFNFTKTKEYVIIEYFGTKTTNLYGITDNTTNEEYCFSTLDEAKTFAKNKEVKNNV